MLLGYLGQIRRDRGCGLNAGFFVIGDKRGQRRRFGIRLSPHDFYLLVDTKHLRHFLFELGIARIEIVRDLVGLDILRTQNLEQGAAGQTRQAWIARRVTVVAHMGGQQARRP